MLEIPILAACLGVIHFWLRFRETERRRDLWISRWIDGRCIPNQPEGNFSPLFHRPGPSYRAPVSIVETTRYLDSRSGFRFGRFALVYDGGAYP